MVNENYLTDYFKEIVLNNNPYDNNLISRRIIADKAVIGILNDMGYENLKELYEKYIKGEDITNE